MPLPVIAPHPIQQEQPVWTGTKPFTLVPPFQDVPQTRPFEGSIYTQGDLPPRVLQQIPQRNCSLDTSPITPETDTFGVRQTGIPSQHHPPRHPDRDSGIDVSYPGLPSEWSHISTSSMRMPAFSHQIPTSHEPPMNEIQRQYYASTTHEMPCPPRGSSMQSVSWQNPKPELEYDQFWSSGLPPDVRSRYGPIKGFHPTMHDLGHIKSETHGYGHLNGR